MLRSFGKNTLDRITFHLIIATNFDSLISVTLLVEVKAPEVKCSLYLYMFVLT